MKKANGISPQDQILHSGFRTQLELDRATGSFIQNAIIFVFGCIKLRNDIDICHLLNMSRLTLVFK